jgi:hypothetical protein
METDGSTSVKATETLSVVLNLALLLSKFEFLRPSLSAEIIFL